MKTVHAQLVRFKADTIRFQLTTRGYNKIFSLRNVSSERTGKRETVGTHRKLFLTNAESSCGDLSRSSLASKCEIVGKTDLEARTVARCRQVQAREAFTDVNLTDEPCEQNSDYIYA